MTPEEAYRHQLHYFAVLYVSRGWSIAPLAPVTYYVNAHGKLAKNIRPLVKWKTDKPVDTLDEARYWFGGGCSATYGLAVITGPSGVLMLDEDSYKAEFGGALELPAGSWVESGGGQGGRHVYVRNALGARNTAGTIAPGVDTRGEGGLSIAAPTWTFFPDGRATQWLPVELMDRLPWPASLPLAEQGTPVARAVTARAHSFEDEGPSEVGEAWALRRLQEAHDEWRAVARGLGLHTATGRFLGVLLRYLLATGVPEDDLLDAAEPWLEQHPDWGGSIEAWDSLPDFWEWCVARAVAGRWTFVEPGGLDARFPWPELIPATPAYDAPPADALAWQLSRLAKSSRATARARLDSLRSRR